MLALILEDLRRSRILLILRFLSFAVVNPESPPARIELDTVSGQLPGGRVASHWRWVRVVPQRGGDRRGWAPQR